MLVRLVGFFVLCFVVAAFGAQFTPGEWYAGLNKPSWNPPNWIFGPVWTALYAAMAVAGWLISKSNSTEKKTALIVFGIQLLLNGVWSWLFFGLNRPDLAFAEIVVLAASITICLVLFWRINRLAGLLLAPYLAWVSFAAFLNFTIWQLNR